MYPGRQIFHSSATRLSVVSSQPDATQRSSDSLGMPAGGKPQRTIRVRSHGSMPRSRCGTTTLRRWLSVKRSSNLPQWPRSVEKPTPQRSVRAAQEAVNTWLAVADEALRAGRFDAALKALEDVDPGVTTATQTVRLRTLKHDAEARRAEALEEAARQRKGTPGADAQACRHAAGDRLWRRHAVHRWTGVSRSVAVFLSSSPWHCGGCCQQGRLLPRLSRRHHRLQHDRWRRRLCLQHPIVSQGSARKAIVGAGVGGSPPAPATPEPSDIAAAEVAPADVEPTAEVAPPVDRVQTALTAVGELLVAREFADAFGRA